jgi:hypothetical protein
LSGKYRPFSGITIIKPEDITVIMDNIYTINQDHANFSRGDREPLTTAEDRTIFIDVLFNTILHGIIRKVFG